jgi:hypothetical protein
MLSLGYIKIAAEFALSCGVAREALDRVLRIDETGKGKLFFDRNVITYLPQGAIDRVYEYYKPLLEPNYPAHTLLLFTINDAMATMFYIAILSFLAHSRFM